MANEYPMERLSEIIDTINFQQQLFNSNFSQENKMNINFGSRGITECMNYSIFPENIEKYIEFLNLKFIGSEEYFKDTVSLNLVSRIKLKDSIYKKLHQYSLREIKTGRIFMIKCLNDLMGFRIILENVDENKDEIRKLLEEKKSSETLWRYYERNDGDYIGIHCYFKVNNLCFPWELQIWDKKWEKKNLEDHKRHEQEKNV
ncbi:nucleotidyltransferase family protein [Weissella viridescens]